jgi:hypothetical protein
MLDFSRTLEIDPANADAYQGAVVAGAIHQERFMFQDFVNIATVRKNPKNAISIFPPGVGVEILKFAGVKPPAATKSK